MYPCVSHLANKYKLVYLLKIIHTPKAYIVELDSTPWMVNVMKQYAAAAAHHKILEETSKFRTLTLIGGGGGSSISLYKPKCFVQSHQK